MVNKPVWDLDGRDWPNREASRFVSAAGLTWHVQHLGRGPVLLLVHGTGAATHSWRSLAPRLAAAFTVIAPDLPGHGFTASPAPARLSLPGMARDLGTLLEELEVEPALVVGHSAGAAIAARMVLDELLAPQGLVSLNGALLPLRGLAGHIFSPMAKLFARSPLTARLFARRANDPAAIERLLRGTGSAFDREGVALYRRLVSRPGHVAAALNMMANWDLEPLARELGALRVPLLLLVGDNDRTIPPSDARRAGAILPSARLEWLPGLGHLAHEEAPDAVAGAIRIFAQTLGIGADAAGETRASSDRSSGRNEIFSPHSADGV